MGIDPTKVAFKPLSGPPDGGAPTRLPVEDEDVETRPLSVAQAKQGLAAFFKISPDAINITIEM
jgi:hypothetical protein